MRLHLLPQAKKSVKIYFIRTDEAHISMHWAGTSDGSLRHVADTETITCQKWDTHKHRGNMGMKRTAAAHSGSDVASGGVAGWADDAVSTVANDLGGGGEKVSEQVASYTKLFPLLYGNSVSPSGRRPSPLSSPAGSRTLSSPAPQSARRRTSLRFE